jgi:hypothetical protein
MIAMYNDCCPSVVVDHENVSYMASERGKTLILTDVGQNT